MKEVGKVKDYNGYFGTIVSPEGNEYLLIKDEIIDNSKLEEEDLVSYKPEIFEDIEENKNIARFVRKYNKKDYH